MKNKQVSTTPPDNTGRVVNQKGIWKRFLHTCMVADISYPFLAFYIVLVILEGILLVKIPEVNGNFFSGDVSVSTVAAFIGCELLSMCICQGVLFVNHILRYRINRNLRNVLWKKILKLKPSYFDEVSASTLITRITVDADSLNSFILDVLLDGVSQVYYLILTVVAMSEISIKAGLVLLVFVPLTLLVSWIMGRLNLKNQNRARFSLSTLTEYLSEILSVLPLQKAFNMQREESRRGTKKIDDYYKANRNLIGLDILNEIIGNAVGILPEVLLILIGIRFLNDGTFDAASWYTFYLYAGTFLSFFTLFGSIWQQSKTIQGQLNKVTDILYETEEAVTPYVEAINSDGDIQFDHVSFSYGTQSVLNDVSLTIPGNQVTAVIGYSGSGKTTLVRLLERLYEPVSGRILCHGKTISSMDVRSWRESIAYVMQDTPLLSGTIRDNLLYGIHRTVTDEEIENAMHLVNLNTFLETLPDGLDHEVGQFGSSLSGGQRQKIALAGAILSGSHLLILDEPTASLDIISTREIMKTVSSLKGTHTIVLITHDRDAISTADHLIVVESDHTYKEGTQDEILKTSEFFKKLMEGGEDQ